MLAYTRYVLDTGMRADLLALKVALTPCVIGYAEIATRLASRPNALAATNPYRVWMAEFAGAPYQEVAAKTRAHLEGPPCLILTFTGLSSPFSHCNFDAVYLTSAVAARADISASGQPVR
jgi:TENA/THI-4/PQQC family